MVFEDRIQVNPRLLRLKNTNTNEIIDFEIQDLEPEEIIQEGTEVGAEELNDLLDVTKTTDANGWTKLEYGDGRIEYVRRTSLQVTLPSNDWRENKVCNFPVGYTSSNADVILTTSVYTSDSAISVACGAKTSGGIRELYATTQNKYSGQVSTTIAIMARILVLPD